MSNPILIGRSGGGLAHRNTSIAAQPEIGRATVAGRIEAATTSDAGTASSSDTPMELFVTTVALRGPRGAGGTGGPASSQASVTNDEEALDGREVQIVYGVGAMDGLALLMGFARFSGKYRDERIKTVDRYWMEGKGSTAIPAGFSAKASHTSTVSRHIIEALIDPAESCRLYMLSALLAPAKGPLVPKVAVVRATSGAAGLERWCASPKGLVVPYGHRLVATASLRIMEWCYSDIPDRPPMV